MMRCVRWCGYVAVQNGFAPRTSKGPDALSSLGCRCPRIFGAELLDGGGQEFV